MFRYLLFKRRSQKQKWRIINSVVCSPQAAKLVPPFGIEGVAWSAQRIPTAVNFGFLDRSSIFLQIAPQLYSWGWVNPVPGPLLLRKSGSAGNWTRDLWTYSQEHWPLDHSGGHYKIYFNKRICSCLQVVVNDYMAELLSLAIFGI
jgi:hypothetical protein